MKFSLGMLNFLEEISSFSHSIVFLYFFALITEEGFLISPCYSLKLHIQMGKTRDLFMKIRDTQGTFHAKMGSIKDRNGMDLPNYLFITNSSLAMMTEKDRL